MAKLKFSSLHLRGYLRISATENAAMSSLTSHPTEYEAAIGAPSFIQIALAMSIGRGAANHRATANAKVER